MRAGHVAEDYCRSGSFARESKRVVGTDAVQVRSVEKILMLSEKLSATMRWAKASRTRQPGSVKRSPTSSAELARTIECIDQFSCAAGGGESEGAVGPCEDISTPAQTAGHGLGPPCRSQGSTKAQPIPESAEGGW